MKKKFLIHLFSFLTIFVLSVSLVGAQGERNDAPGVKIGPTIPNPLRTGDDIYLLLMKIVDEILIPIGGIIAVLAFIWVGFMFVNAQGNSTEIGKARTALLYVCIGTAIILGAKGIIILLTGTINSIR